MLNGSVRNRILIGFGAMIVIITVLCGLAFVRLADIRSHTDNITKDTWPGLYHITRLDSHAKSHYAHLFEYVTADSASQREKAAAAVVADQAGMVDESRKYDATIILADDRKLFAQIDDAQRHYVDAAEQVRALAPSTAKDAALATFRRKVEPAFRQYADLLTQSVEQNRETGDESNRGIIAAVTNAQFAMEIGLAAGLLLALLSAYMIIGRVQLTTSRVNRSAVEIAATAQQHLSTANEIAATTSEIGATSTEISATSRDLVETISDIADVAERAATLAGSGQDGLARMETTMAQMMEASASINARLGVLNEKAGAVGSVVTTISKVADQTNLLSLNAAIEAEKAGEYGRGFAVVATEIRRLADQTAVATYDIEQMVKEMQSAVSAGVMGMDKFSEEVRRSVGVAREVSGQLKQIIQQVQTLTPSFETVREGMQSQAVGAQQISDALSQLAEATQQTVESLRQSNQAIEQLKEAARGLQGSVADYRLAPA